MNCARIVTIGLFLMFSAVGSAHAAAIETFDYVGNLFTDLYAQGIPVPEANITASVTLLVPSLHGTVGASVLSGTAASQFTGSFAIPSTAPFTLSNNSIVAWNYDMSSRSYNPNTKDSIYDDLSSVGNANGSEDFGILTSCGYSCDVVIFGDTRTPGTWTLVSSSPSPPPAPAPVPGALPMLASAIAGMGALAYRKRTQS